MTEKEIIEWFEARWKAEKKAGMVYIAEGPLRGVIFFRKNIEN